MWFVWVWSGSLDTEEVLTHQGLLRHAKNTWNLRNMRGRNVSEPSWETLRKLRRPQNRWFLPLCSSLIARESVQDSTVNTKSQTKIPGNSQFWFRSFLRSCSPLQFYVDRGRRYYTYCKWKLNGSCRRDWRALSECDSALYAHDAKLHGWKLKHRSFPSLWGLCWRWSARRGEARVFALRKAQYVARTHFGISTQQSRCASMTSCTDKLNSLKTGINLNCCTENSVASSQKTRCICITKTNWFIMFRKMIITYSENHYVHIQCVVNAESLSVITCVIYRMLQNSALQSCTPIPGRYYFIHS